MQGNDILFVPLVQTSQRVVQVASPFLPSDHNGTHL